MYQLTPSAIALQRGMLYEPYDSPALKAHSFRGGMKTQTDTSRY